MKNRKYSKFSAMSADESASRTSHSFKGSKYGEIGFDLTLDVMAIRVKKAIQIIQCLQNVL
jgi:hypothetical protein